MLSWEFLGYIKDVSQIDDSQLWLDLFYLKNTDVLQSDL